MLRVVFGTCTNRTATVRLTLPYPCQTTAKHHQLLPVTTLVVITQSHENNFTVLIDLSLPTQCLSKKLESVGYVCMKQMDVQQSMA